MRLERQPAFPARIPVRYVRHFDASKAWLIGPEPKFMTEKGGSHLPPFRIYSLF
jgi:hypothetical protein